MSRLWDPCFTGRGELEQISLELLPDGILFSATSLTWMLWFLVTVRHHFVVLASLGPYRCYHCSFSPIHWLMVKASGLLELK